MAQDNRGKTPLDGAIANQKTEVKEMLETYMKEH